MSTYKNSVPVAIAAKVYGKDAAWVRAGIIAGWLPIGVATRDGKPVTSVSQIDSRKGRINFYISPLKLYEQTGYYYGKEEEMGIRNHEGYKDPTAELAIQKVDKEIENDDITKLVGIVRSIANLAGYDIEGRIIFRDLSTGRIWR